MKHVLCKGLEMSRERESRSIDIEGKPFETTLKNDVYIISSLLNTIVSLATCQLLHNNDTNAAGLAPLPSRHLCSPRIPTIPETKSLRPLYAKFVSSKYMGILVAIKETLYS